MARSRLFLSHQVVLLLLLVALPQAAAFQTQKFVAWFPRFQNALDFSWAPGGQCQKIYDNFVYDGIGECGRVLNCILENTDELRKTTISSAQVLLGVTPPLLAALGSSVAEISLLAVRCPVLMLFLTLGAPATFPTRTCEFTHPVRTLESLPGGMGVSELSWSMPRLITVLQYCFAAAAAANTIALSLDLGSRSVLVWACKSWWVPMFWVLFALTTYAAAGLSYFVVTKTSCRRRSKRNGKPKRRAPSSLHLGKPVSPLGVLPRGLNEPEATPTVVISLQLLASGLAFAHVLLGTLILSSLIFIGFHDTLKILARLISSALVCRVIAMLELGRIQYEMAESARDVIGGRAELYIGHASSPRRDANIGVGSYYETVILRRMSV